MTKKIQDTYSFPYFEVVSFRSSVNASINHEVNDSRYAYSNTPVYRFHTDIEMVCCRLGEEGNSDVIYNLSIYQSEDGMSDTLDDHHVRDDEGNRKYRKRKDQRLAIYDIPKGIGIIDPKRKSMDVWMASQTISDMLTMLTSTQPLFIAAHERQVGRVRHVVGLALQNSNPEED